MTKVKDLIPDDKNYNKGNEFGNALIEKSLRKLGAGRSILIDKNNRIIAGNKTIENAGAIGIEDVQIVESDGTKIIAVKRTDIDLDTPKGREMALADNASAKANIEWDFNALDSDWSADEQKEWGIVKEFTAEEAGEDDYQIPDEIQTDIVLGDLFEIGEHRLLCGDATSSDAAERLMNGQKADILFTSPPYGAGNVAKLRNKYERGAEELESFYNEHEDNPTGWIDLMCGWVNAFMHHADAIICNVQMLADNKKQLFEWANCYADQLVDVMIWDKENGAPQMQKKVLNCAYEFIFILGGNGSRSIPHADFHGSIQNIFRLNSKGKNEFSGVHKATFPIGLPSFIIGDLCHLATTVVDCFCGTGTTMVAAHQLNRKCYGMEIDPQYCQVIIDRWEKFTGQKAIKVE